MSRKIRTVLLLSAVISSSIYLSTPAGAIFGLSKCDKVKSSIKKEEEIQKYAWKTYDVARDSAVVNMNMTLRDYTELLYGLNLVWKSDLQVFRSVKNNPSCFQAESVAGVRDRIRYIESFIKQIEVEIKTYSNVSSAVSQLKASDNQLAFVRNAYKSAPKSWLRILK
jgi:hypothetical protein